MEWELGALRDGVVKLIAEFWCQSFQIQVENSVEQSARFSEFNLYTLKDPYHWTVLLTEQ